MPKRVPLALRGLGLCAVLLAAATGVVAESAGVFRTATTITCLLPASAGPVEPDTPVRYRGVTVGTVTEVDADFSGSRLTVKLTDGVLGRIPATVRARLLPRTVFGDQYVALSVPDGRRTARTLEAGAVVEADTSTRTVRLYTAFSRLYELISSMHPAQIRMALDTLADVLRGRGAEIGRMIDKAARLLDSTQAMIEKFSDDLRAVVELGRSLADAAPEILATIRNAVSLSKTVVAEQNSIHALLTAGSALAGQAQRSLAANGRRIIRLVHAVESYAEVFARHPNVITKSMDAAGEFLSGGIRAFSTGRFKINAALTLDHPYPYTAEDCPRYPGNAGPNCPTATPEVSTTPPRASSDPADAPGGTVGPVGSKAEDRKLRRLGSLLTDEHDSEDDPESAMDVDLLGLLLGPLVRGQQVMIP